MKIVFDLKAPDDRAAFYGLYAGLRMYIERHGIIKSDPGLTYDAVTENFYRLEELKAEFPDQFEQARQLYNKTDYKR